MDDGPVYAAGGGMGGGAGSSSSFGTVVPATKISPVPEQLDHLSDAISRLDHQLDILFGRITPALGPDFGEPGNAPGLDTPSRSDLTATLADHVSRLQRLGDSVQNIARRVEL